MYVQKSCYMAETNPDFTNKFSIYSLLLKNHPVTGSVQSIRLCSALLHEQQSSEGLTNTGVSSSHSQSSCPEKWKTFSCLVWDLKDFPVLTRKFMKTMLPKNTGTVAETVFIIYTLCSL